MGTHSALMIRFFWRLLFASVAASVLGLVFLTVFSVQPPPVLVALPPAYAAWDAGRHYRLVHAATPTQGSAWVLSLVFLFVYVATLVFLFGGAIAAQGGTLGSIAPFLLPAMLFAVLFLLLIRFMFWLGARHAA